MTWESRLVSTYCLLCKHSDLIYCSALRHSNNAEPAFTDIEVMTIYLYVSTRGGGYTTKKAIYDYANDHLRSWFPLLPKYHAFVQRCNHLESAMQLLGNALYADLAVNMPENNQFICEYLVDSLPIMMAKNQRCKTARVAPEIASVGYCATKKMAYYGLKIHAAGLMSAQKKLPLLSVMAITAASPHDLTGFKQDLARNCTNAKVYADSAYCDKGGASELKQLYNVTICPIQKRDIGQEELGFLQKCQNSAISAIRQPIEGLFNWLIEHTGIQDASKCRATKGVLFHIHAKIAASAVILALKIAF